MDLFFLGNALLFLGAFAVQFGLLPDTSDDSGQNAETGGTETDAPADLPIYDPANYAVITPGTDGADDFVAAGDPGQAWFLAAGDDMLDATPGADYVEGGSGDDDLTLRPGNDLAFGGDGNDTIDGGLGDDTLEGGAGNDLINGSKDNDTVRGDAGADTLTGSQGNDLIEGGSGDDALYGNTIAKPGADDDGTDTLDGGEGDDALHLGLTDIGTGGAGADSFTIYESDDDTGAPARITDFDPAEDTIAVLYTPALDGDGNPIDPVLSVSATPDGTGATITLDGIDIGLVIGGQALTLDDIALLPS